MGLNSDLIAPSICAKADVLLKEFASVEQDFEEQCQCRKRTGLAVGE